jgi:hypothetical protein
MPSTCRIKETSRFALVDLKTAEKVEGFWKVEGA